MMFRDLNGNHDAFNTWYVTKFEHFFPIVGAFSFVKRIMISEVYVKSLK